MNNKLNLEFKKTRTRKKEIFKDDIKEDCCTEKDMRIIKFETLIDDVQNAFFDENFTTSINESKKGIFSESIIKAISDACVTNIEVVDGNIINNNISNNSSLGLIYDYNKLNEYGKVIVNHSRPNNAFVNSWISKYNDMTCFDDFKYKLNVAREFIKLCKKNGNTDEGYKFIFWSMFILAVDKNDAEEKLSLICDFARMLNISDNELMYIFIVLKSIIHKKNYEQKFIEESEFGEVDNNVRKIFSGVLSLCEN